MKCAQVTLNLPLTHVRNKKQNIFSFYLILQIVSQVEQAANLKNEGYELVGWFHSHPTFEANPSRTDVGTQADMQLQFSVESDRPFIGFILNCIDMGYK